MKKAIFIISLIFMAAIPIIADDSVARWCMDQVRSRETAQDETFERQKAASLESPKAFVEKEAWSLKARHSIIRYVLLMGNYPLAKDLSAATLARFKDSALATDPLYQDFIYFQGRAWEGAGEYKFVNARASYSLFLETFPENPLAADAKQRLGDLNLLVNH